MISSPLVMSAANGISPAWLAARAVARPDVMLAAAGGQPLLAAERQAEHLAGRGGERKLLRPGLRIPHADGVVARNRDNALAVGTEGDGALRHRHAELGEQFLGLILVDVHIHLPFRLLDRPWLASVSSACP